jgi:hypothetical protein
MSYEEEDTCHMRRLGGYDRRRYVSYEEEDTCHMRRRIHVI